MNEGSKIRLGVLISGGGTTLVNFLDAMAAGRLQAEIPLVIASRPDCGGIAKANRAGIRVVILTRSAYRSVDEFSAAVFAHCREAQVDLVVLAGFLCLLKIPDEFLGKTMNIHPSLIPAFCGKDYHGHKVHEAALARGVKLSGCTVHFADNEYDHGPIILQQAVPVHDDDTPETLARRVFTAECEAFPEAIELFRQRRLKLDGTHVRILPVGE